MILTHQKLDTELPPSFPPLPLLPIPSPPLLPPPPSLHQEVTQQLAQYWQKWVNFTDVAMETVKRSACYSVVIPNTNLKLVSFNANYGYVLIWYNNANEH